MFYSHEILNDRKHGVATIWLVATMGSKSSLRKITRKAILDVNLPNACDTITDPDTPMALRLQGSLLFGVSKVFSQQCAYMLSDMQNLWEKMRGMTMLLKELEIDPDVARTRPEQLNLQLDPDFNIDLDLGFDLSGFDISFTSSEPSSQMSPRTLASSQTSFFDEEHGLGEIAPLDPSSSGIEHAEAVFGFDEARSVRAPPVGLLDLPLPPPQDDDAELFDDGSMQVAEDGEIVFRNPSSQPMIDQPKDDGGSIPSAALDDFDLRLDLGDQQEAEQPSQQPAVNVQSSIGGYEAVQLAGEDAGTDIGIAPSPPSDTQQLPVQSEGQVPQTETLTGTAPQRNRNAKGIPVDIPAELRNRTLGEWNDNYLTIMTAAATEKAAAVSLAQAKRNAAYWVVDHGVGGIENDYRSDLFDHPLAIFSGQSLLDMFVQNTSSSQKRKRSVSGSDDEENNADHRRVRSRSDESHEVPADNQQQTIEDETGVTIDDDDFGPELGRHQPAPLSEHDSMPWNAYASSRQTSRQGSRAPMSAAAASSSVAGPAPFDFNLPSSIGSKRISRLIAESPLEQRRRILRESSQARSVSSHGHENLVLGELGGDDNTFGIDDDVLDRQLGGDLDADDFELYGPAARVSTQQAANSQWLAATLEQEALNFLNFLKTTLDGMKEDLDAEEEIENPHITFAELLPPANNSEVVAAQGLLHALSLATKGLVSIRQEDDFGDIFLSIASEIAVEENNGSEA